MHLKRLELSGFKSFAKKTTLDFPRGITVVAGPNGSGKSNVVDAIRWALAEQSFKNLRGKKGEDLIFYGSAGRNSLARAGVAMHFDFADSAAAAGDKTNPFGFSEAVVAREVDKSGENSYILNGRKVRLSDMAEFLAQSRVGDSSYRVISQGMSDKLLNLSPQEFRNFIEEAAGVKEYQDKKYSAVARLAHARENLEKVRSILAELEPQLKILKREKDKLEKKGEYLNQLKNAARDFFGLKYGNVLAWENKISEHRKKTSLALKPLAAEVKKLKDDIFSFDNKNSWDSEVAALTAEIRKLEGEENQTTREIISAEGKISLEEERRRLPVSVDYLKDKIGALAARLSVDFKGMDAESLRGLAAGVAVALRDLLKIMETGIDPAGSANAVPLLKQGLEKLLTVRQEIKLKLEKVTLARTEKERAFMDDRKISLAKERTYREKESELYRLESALRQVELDEEKLKLHQAKFHQDLNAVGVVTLAEVISHGPTPQAVFAVSSFAPPSSGTTEGRGKATEDKTAEAVLETRVWKLKKRLEDVGSIDDKVIQEYEGASERFNFLSKESEDLTQTLGSLTDLVSGLEKQVAVRYKTALSEMNHAFGGYFRLIFGGGKALLTGAKQKNPALEKDKLRLASDNLSQGRGIDESEDESNGVELKLELPGKKIKSLATLSGGERTLTSIALLFALASIRKPPVMVLDEIDAALDEANTQKFTRLVKELSRDTQFIIITHNRETMRAADALYGVSMKDGISHLLSLKLQSV